LIFIAVSTAGFSPKYSVGELLVYKLFMPPLYYHTTPAFATLFFRICLGFFPFHSKISLNFIYFAQCIGPDSPILPEKLGWKIVVFNKSDRNRAVTHCYFPSWKI